jgi:poly(A) polymerase
VRIVRAVRFAAKLGFALEPATQAPVRAMAPLLANVPASRLSDEMIKLLQTGHALASVAQLRSQGLLGTGVFPLLDAVLAVPGSAPAREAFVEAALRDTDRRVAEGRAVAPSFLLACLLWHDVLARWAALKAGGESPFPALAQAVDAVFDARIGDISGRGKLGGDMREIWLMQPRFDRRTPAAALSLVNQLRFRAAYDFLRLRADCGEVPAELADWWEDFHLGSDEDREALLRDVRPATPKVRRVPAPRADPPASAAPAAPAPPVPGASRSAGPAGSGRDGDDEPGDDEAGAEDGAEDGTDSAASGDAPKRRRRRRRRRPGGGAGAAEGAAPPAGDGGPGR